MLGRLEKREIERKVIVAEFAVDPEFSFQAGEYVKIFLSEEDKRYFTIASSPNEKAIIRIATRPGTSEFKKTLAQMQIGTEVEIEGPWGDVLLPKDASRPLVFIAGGIGITPFLSMLAYIAEERLPYDVTLLYFTDDGIFEKELIRVIGEIGKGRLRIVPERIASEIIKEHVGDIPNSLFYVAGPPGFVNTAAVQLDGLGIPPARIIFESYTGY